MQDAIILYENGNAIGGEGHPTNASDITFENEGTDLVAETTQAAIVEVNEKTKHGIVELWVNTSPSSNFAAQFIEVPNFDTTKFDAIILVVGISTNESFTPYWYEIDLDIALSTPGYTSSLNGMQFSGAYSKMSSMSRNVSMSMSGTTLRIAIADCGMYVQNAIGTAATFSTDNSRMIPYRILGLMHNS